MGVSDRHLFPGLNLRSNENVLKFSSTLAICLVGDSFLSFLTFQLHCDELKL